MNTFFNSIINWLRGVKASVASHFYPGYTKTYQFGQIISGKYTNWKHDMHPTIFCMGTYINQRNGRSYVHGFNLHYLNSYDLQWLLKLIYMMKRGGQVVNPRQFYYYIKANNPNIVKTSYRIYHTALCKYYTISPGVSSISVKSCYSIDDSRDMFVSQLNSMIDAAYGNNLSGIKPLPQVSYDKNELQDHIQQVLNSRKVW